jgi:hypothetical protein
LEVVRGSRLLGFLLRVLLQGGDALAQSCEARLELLFANETLGLAVNEAAQPLTQLAQLRGRGAALGVGGALLHRLGASGKLGFQTRGIFQRRTHLRPDRGLDRGSRQRRRVTERLAAEARSVAPAATVVRALLAAPILGPIRDC